jgi:hypothetical protein
MTTRTTDLDRMHPRVPELSSAIGRASDGLWQDPSGRNQPFPELSEPDGADYELSIWVHFAYDNYQRGADGHWPPVVIGDYVLACGREDGRWRLTTSPLLGHDDEGDGDITSEPIVNLRDQQEGLQPLTLLRALLGGRLV